MKVNEIDYSTGKVSVGMYGLTLENLPGVIVLKPGKTAEDIYSDIYGALAYLGQIASEDYEFSFLADQEGVYNIYANMGTELKHVGAAYYKPFGVSVELKQGNNVITEFTNLAANTPLNVTARVDNSNASSANYLFTCAKYKGGKLVGVSAVDGTLDSTKANETVSLTLDIGALTEFDSVKVFFWKDKTRLIPVIDTIEL